MKKDSDWEGNIDNPIEEDNIVIDKRDFLDANGVNIYTKKSGEKTVEERIKTSRSFKIKNNKWNQVDYVEEHSNDKITIDPRCTQFTSTYEDVEFEKQFHETIKNSKFKEILLGDDVVNVNYQVINDIIIHCYAKMKSDYSLVQIFVMVCEYCGISLQVMWKRISSYLQLQILEELTEISKLPNEILNESEKLF